MNYEALILEFNYKAVRSSGKGGQHVNKVATKMEVSFDLINSKNFSQEEKVKLLDRLKNRLNKEGVLVMQCSATRSQLKNKEIVTQRLLTLLEEGLKEQKVRVPTKVPKSVKEKRIKDKKRLADKKSSRQKPRLD